MSKGRFVWRMLRSVLALSLAGAAICAVNMLGGGLGDGLAACTGLPAGGTPRLAWDLGWVLASGTVAALVLAKAAPAAPRAHVAGLFAALLALVAYALARQGEDWPRWFGAGLVLGLPLQAWLGLRLAAYIGPRGSLHSHHDKERQA